jgi:lysozyme family protein
MVAKMNPPRVGAVRRSRARFDEVIDRVLKHEDASYDPASPTGGGRTVNNPRDPGGHTRLGITLTTLRLYRSELTLEPSALDELSLAEIKDIYYSQYWLPVRADELPRGLDYAVFDCAVNSGPRRAAFLLQETLGDAAGRKDGIIGPLTVAAAKAADVQETIREFSVRRLAFLARLPHAAAFGRGWRKRVEEVERMALADAERSPEPLTVAETLKTNTVRTGGTVAALATAVMAAVEQLRPLVSALDGLPVWAAAAIVAAAAVAVLFFMRRKQGEP